MIKFCDKCMEKVECIYNEKEVTIKINDNEIKYLKKYYVCKECKNEFLDDYYDYDVETVNNELRKINNIITPEEIEEILKKYDIGKKPLSIILGLGEVNIIRYLNGSNPTKEISDLLKKILINPFLYELYLQAAKDKIAEVAYKKSLGKTKQLELNNSNSKIYNSALYIIDYLNETDALAVQKTLFFANGFSEFFLNKKLFNDQPEAWIHGPVYKEIYDCFSYYKGNKIEYQELTKNMELSLEEDERKYLNEIIKAFGCYSGSLLREMTHLTTPWRNARKGLKDDEYSSRIIENKDISDYFKKVYEEYNMKNTKDILKYSNKLFKEAMKIKFNR